MVWTLGDKRHDTNTNTLTILHTDTEHHTTFGIQDPSSTNRTRIQLIQNESNIQTYHKIIIN